MEIPKGNNDPALISRYLHEKTGYIVDMLAEGLRSLGIRVSAFISGPRTLIRITKGSVCGSVDLQRTIVQIATTDNECRKFDIRLNSPGYELAKMTAILTLLARVIMAAMDAGDERDRIAKLSEISRSSENLRIQIIKSE